MEAEQESQQVSRLVELADKLLCENARLQTAIQNSGLVIGACQICGRPCACEDDEMTDYVCDKCWEFKDEGDVT